MSNFEEAVGKMMQEKVNADSPKEEIKEDTPDEKKDEPVLDRVQDGGNKEEEGKESPELRTEKEEEPKETNKELEELRAKLLEAEEKLNSESTKDVFANDYIRKMNEIAKSGVDVNSEDFYRWQQIDIDKFDLEDKDSALAIVSLSMGVENPELTREEIEFEIQEKYPSLFDDKLDLEFEDDKAKFDKALKRLKIDAKKSKPKVEDYKSKITLPKVDLNERQKQEELAKQAKENFAKATNQKVSEYKSQEIDLGDIKLNFEVNDEHRKAIESNIVNNETFFTDRYVKEGQIDFKSLQRDMLILSEFDTMLKMAHDQGVSKGKESIVDNLESSPKDNNKSQGSGQTTAFEQALTQINNSLKK